MNEAWRECPLCRYYEHGNLLADGQHLTHRTCLVGHDPSSNRYHRSVSREVCAECEVPLIYEAVKAPTHKANDYNCEDWPPESGCRGCRGNELRRIAVAAVEARREKP